MSLLIPLIAAQNSISVATDQPQYVVGSSIFISGKVLDGHGSPVEGAGVSVQVDDPQNAPVHVNLVYTDQTGMYADKFQLLAGARQGIYNVFASTMIGPNNTGPAQTQFTVILENSSTVTSTTITQSVANASGSKCLIATATFGSEMAPEVGLLRSFRDSQITHTAAGMEFMLTFNAFYYSFSPQVAAYIFNHPNTRPLMKLFLYPAITILSVMRILDSVLAPNPEIAISLSGIFASFTLGVVYFGLPFGLLRLVKKGKRTEAMIRWSVLYCTISVSILAVAELVNVSVLLLIGSSVVVLSFLALGGLTVPYLVERRLMASRT